jgi:hypothetical protein
MALFYGLFIYTIFKEMLVQSLSRGDSDILSFVGYSPVV